MKNKLEWYAIMIDLNSNKVKYINVLNESITDFTLKKLKKYKEINYNDVKVELSRSLMSIYWSRVEYEILVKDLFKDGETKIDVWYQLEPNIDRITEYFINNTKLKKVIKNAELK